VVQDFTPVKDVGKRSAAFSQVKAISRIHCEMSRGLDLGPAYGPAVRPSPGSSAGGAGPLLSRQNGLSGSPGFSA
jgi:hypothetical protein